MKKIIPFTSDIEFSTKIFEINSISLEHDLKLKNDNLIKGEFIVTGDYKVTSSSFNNESFIQTLPFEIVTSDLYDPNTLEIDIDDFSYEIIDEEVLRVNINVLLNGVKLIKEEIVPDIKIESDERKVALEKEDQEKEEEKASQEEIKVISDIGSFNEEYVTYNVHIVRDDDTIDKICKDYKVKLSEIEKYNDISEITLGSKIIIPYVNE